MNLDVVIDLADRPKMDEGLVAIWETRTTLEGQKAATLAAVENKANMVVPLYFILCSVRRDYQNWRYNNIYYSLCLYK